MTVNLVYREKYQKRGIWARRGRAKLKKRGGGSSIMG
jgi:hypothetical protein